MNATGLPFDVAALRAEFPILSRPVNGRALHYLDNGASAQTPQVRERPTLVVPSIVNKYYAFDLAPGRSVLEHFVKNGLTMFVMVWRNPRPEHDHWGMAHYQDAIDEAIDAVREICDVPDVNIWGVCGAGPVVTSLVAHHVAMGQRKVNSLMLVVSPHDMSQRNKIPGLGGFTDSKLTEPLKRLPSRRISANTASRSAKSSAAVTSSRISTRGLRVSARASTINCCAASGTSPAGSSSGTRVTANSARTLSASARRSPRGTRRRNRPS